jgi:hypothetical protein
MADLISLVDLLQRLPDVLESEILETLQVLLVLNC